MSSNSVVAVWSANRSYPASTAGLVLISRLMGSDRDCSGLTGNPETGLYRVRIM
jgi:hypothetical protein